MKVYRVDMFAFLAAAAIMAAWVIYTNNVKEKIPASEWFAVRNISVPDFTQGEDPVITYDRVILKPFTGTWDVEIHGATASNSYAICSASGKNFYEPTEILPEAGVKMSWFFGFEAWKNCSLNEGLYAMETHWKIESPGYPVKYYSATSNPFRVIPKGSQLYLDPEKIEQLDKAQKLLDNPKIQEQLLESTQ